MPLLKFKHHTDVPKDEWPWRNFTPRELACKGTGRLEIDSDSISALQSLRLSMNRPLKVSSGYRSPEYNDAVSSTGLDGPHTKGCAFDILVYGSDAQRLIVLASDYGFTRIGVSQKGIHNERFLHLDRLATIEFSAYKPWVWSY